MRHLRKGYLAAAAGLLAVEIVIAAAVHDALVRPYAGDFLAPVFLYCLVRGFSSVATRPALAGALVVAYALEGLQYGQLLPRLGLAHWHLLRLVLGSCFEWADVLAYTLGALAGLAGEGLRHFLAALLARPKPLSGGKGLFLPKN